MVVLGPGLGLVAADFGLRLFAPGIQANTQQLYYRHNVAGLSPRSEFRVDEAAQLADAVGSPAEQRGGVVDGVIP